MMLDAASTRWSSSATVVVAIGKRGKEAVVCSSTRQTKHHHSLGLALIGYTLHDYQRQNRCTPSL